MSKHKKILIFVFLIIPILVLFFSFAYSSVIYYKWLQEKDSALEKLTKYKRLIDLTEEMQNGYIYSYNELNVGAQVVDLPTRIYDRDNNIIGEFFEQKRELVPFDYIPKALVNDVIASEDRDFYEHEGVSIKGISRAFLVNLSQLRIAQGGSTITQQLAKVLFTNMERNLKRKIYEVYCAHEIEERYDKRDILAMYLNLIYFGNGAYGVEAASKTFFGKSVQNLSEIECAMIVAAISNPTYYSPLKNINNSLKKTKRILLSSVQAGYSDRNSIDQKYNKFLQQWEVKYNNEGKAISSLIGTFSTSSYRINKAPFFNQHIRRVLIDRFGEDTLTKGGLSVYTTIDLQRQELALVSLKEGIQNQRDYHLQKSTRLSGNKKAREQKKSENIEGAFVTLNPYTGELLSYVGGYELNTANQVDFVAQARRQPGSSFKPLVYVSAIENKDITPATIIVDEKTEFKNGYTPSNYSGKFKGPMIARDALRKSVNVAAVKVLEKTGYQTIFDILQRSLDLSDEELSKRFMPTLSMALGTYELSPMENCRLHSVIVNGGDYIKPYGIKIVKDYQNNILWNNESEILEEVNNKRRRGKIIEPQACAIVVSMMQGVFEPGGTAYRAGQLAEMSVPIAGKTGTSSNFCDVWFVGYTPDSVSAIWIGNKKGNISLGRGRTGGGIVAPVWMKAVAPLYQDFTLPQMQFSIPAEGLTKQTICTKSGLVPRSEIACPTTVVDQLFYAGSEPGDYCNINHRNKAKKHEK